MQDHKDACFKLSQEFWPLSYKIFVFHNLKEKVEVVKTSGSNYFLKSPSYKNIPKTYKTVWFKECVFIIKTYWTIKTNIGGN